MSDTQPPDEDRQEARIYEIRIEGHLENRWADWFDGLTVTLEDGGTTLLAGPVIDQAALYGLLKKLRNLGLALVSINPVQPKSCPGAATHEEHVQCTGHAK